MKKKLRIVAGVIVSIIIGNMLVGIIDNINFKDIISKNENQKQDQIKEQDIFDKLKNDTSNEYENGIQGNEAKYFLVNDRVECEELERARSSYASYFITNDNKLYYYNFEKPFISNQKNCINAFETVENTVANSEYSCIISNANSLITFKNEISVLSNCNSMGFTSINSLYQNNISGGAYILSPIDRPIYQFNKFKAILEGKTIYDSTIHFNYNRLYFAKKNEPIFSVNDDEEIIKILGNNIITDKNIYKYGITNYDCFEYADGVCEEGFKINEDLTKRIDDIIFIDDLYIVFRNGTTYMYRENLYE